MPRIAITRSLSRAITCTAAAAMLALGACTNEPAATGPAGRPSLSETVAADTHPMNKAAASAGAGLMTREQRGSLALTIVGTGTQAHISNGTVQLGVDRFGQLNVPGPTSASGTRSLGLRFVPTNYEATAAGCLCEGWGVADAAAPQITGFANNALGSAGLSLVSFASPDAATATSVVTAGSAAGKQVRVTHAFRPAAETPNLYEVLVTIENIGAASIADLRYRRVMDWDIEPTPFREYSTIQGVATTPTVLGASNNGFASSNPLSLLGGTNTGDFVDVGPRDHGAGFDFGFGTLAAGAKKEFRIYYGAAATESAALTALGAVGAEVYSLGQPSTAGGRLDGTPNTFIFAFKGVGGTVVVPPSNKAPTLAAIPDQGVNEGSLVTFTAVGSDDDVGQVLTYSLIGAPAGATIDAATGVFSWTPADDDPTATPSDVYTFVVKVADDASPALSAERSVNVTVRNLAPDIGAFTTFPTAPLAVGTTVNLLAPFSDPGSGDSFTGTVDWGDGSSSVATIVPFVSISGSHTYAAAGVYTVTFTLADDDTGSDVATFFYVVVYDPDAGFVTGGGWINSPVGAYPADPSLTGKASFGFVSKYKKGMTTPDGQTQFQFHAAGLNFHSTSYEWLVISGPKAQYKGTGTINGAGEYGFLLTANDGQANGGGGVDRFRIKIWDKATGTIVYDNQIGDSDTGNATTALGGGSIVIHAK